MTRYKKASPKFLLCLVAFTLAGATAFYYSKISLNGNLQNVGRAYAFAVNNAFGQTWHLESFAKFSLSDSEKIGCIKLHPKDFHCILTRGNARFYTDFCAWWRLEDCMVVAADPVFLKDEKLQSQLEQVIASPCKFLPSPEEIENKDPYIKMKLKMLPDYVKWDLKHYSEYRKSLGCETPKEKATKVYLAYFDKESLGPTEIKVNSITVGLKYLHTNLLAVHPKIITSVVGGLNGQ